MATKGTNPTDKDAKQKGEWKAEVISEWKSSKAVTWKAQRSTAPDGKVLMGVRQYITTAKMGEIAGKSGITFADDEHLVDNIENVMRLLQDLKADATGTPKRKGKGAAVEQVAAAVKTRKLSKKAQAIKDEEDAEAAEREKSDFVFVKEGNVYLKSCREVDGVMKVKTTEDGDDAQTFALAQATKLSKKLSSKWSMQEL